MSYTPAISNPIFQRSMRTISAITNAYPAEVTTTIDHNYSTGLIVRLIVPPEWGMWQANQQTGAITVTSATTFLVNIDATSYDAFVVPADWPEMFTDAQVVPVGEINEILSQATQNVLPYRAT